MYAVRRLTLTWTYGIFMVMQHHVSVHWWKLYVVASLVCVVLALTANRSDDKSVAWHFGTIIVMAGILAIWRLSKWP